MLSKIEFQAQAHLLHDTLKLRCSFFITRNIDHINGEFVRFTIMNHNEQMDALDAQHIKDVKIPMENRNSQ